MNQSAATTHTSKPLQLTRDGAHTLAAAQAIAVANGQRLLTSNHILLGALETRDSLGGRALSQLPLKVENLKTRLWAYIRLDAGEDKDPYGGEFFGFPLSEDGARAMATAVKEAEAAGQEVIDSRGMILGILKSPDTRSGAILRQFDVQIDTFQQKARLQDARSNAPARRRAFKLHARRQPLLRQASQLPHISPIFLLLVAIMLGLGYMLYAGIGEPGRLTFIFVLTGWILAVSLHEFGHALVAYLSGDESVLHMGYLTLDPLKYTNPLMSIIFPVIFLLMGGIPLPGGAVYINRAAIRKRWQLSLVSAAGPLATILFGLLLLSPLMVGISEQAIQTHLEFWQALSVLAFFQVFAFVLNLIPWPGLDGFGILEPWLPPNILRYAYMLSGMGIFIFFLLFIYTPIGQAVASSVWSIMNAISIDATLLASYGFDQFFFWN